MRNRALKFTLGFVIVSLAVIVLIIVVQRSAINSYQDNLSYFKLGEQLKNQSAQSALWVEKVKKADSNLDFEHDVQAPLSRSKAVLEAIYDGKETEAGSFDKVSD